ncbi:MAG: MlaD family protein, partial [Acidobacteriota bacterium]
MARTRPVYVGAFVIVGLLLFAVGLFLIGNRRMLFDHSFDAYAEFANIAGLQNGAIVRVAGMAAGEVGEINVPPSPSGRFRVRMRLREDLHQLIRVDSVATIQTDGLVGNKYVQVDAGTDQAMVVPPLGTIQSREPFDLSEMLQRMSKTVDLVTDTIVQVRGQLETALNSVSDIIDVAQGLMEDLGNDARAIIASSRKVAADINTIVAGLREGRGSLGKLLNDDALYERVKTISAEAEKTVANVREASEQAKGAIADFRGDQGPVNGVVGDLKQTLASAKDAMSDMAENTEALKRSFFFRGFFN